MPNVKMTGSLAPSELPAMSETTNTPGSVAAPEILPVGTWSVMPGGNGDAFQNVGEFAA